MLLYFNSQVKADAAQYPAVNSFPELKEEPLRGYQIVIRCFTAFPYKVI